MKSQFRIGICIGISMALGRGLQAQAPGSLLSQNKTQVKYLQEQIAALKLFTGAIRQGYQSISVKLEGIRNLKAGELGLYHSHIQSLETLNPEISVWTASSGILDYPSSLIRLFHAAWASCSTSTQLSKPEREFIQSEYAFLGKYCLEDMNELNSTLTGHELQLSDGQRIKRIQAVLSDLGDIYSFARAFYCQVAVLAESRAESHREAAVIQGIYAIP